MVRKSVGLCSVEKEEWLLRTNVGMCTTSYMEVAGLEKSECFQRRALKNTTS